MPDSTLTSAIETETAAVAAALAARVRAGDVVLLEGPLGAGKTVFARSFIRALAGDPALEIPSPTFTLVQTYETPCGKIWHFDLWRLRDHHALEELAWDEARSGICLVEWPDRLGPLAPQDALRITLDVLPQGRAIKISGPARWFDAS